MLKVKRYCFWDRIFSDILIGTTYNGVWDSWYGPSGREGSYSTATIKTSPTGAALASMGKLATAAQMLQLRGEADVKCLGAETTTTKCQPLKEPCLFNILKDPCEQRNLANVYVHLKRSKTCLVDSNFL